MVRQLKHGLYLSRKYSAGRVCREMLPGLFIGGTQANQGTNRQKGAPECLCGFSVCWDVVTLGKKAGPSLIFFGWWRESTSSGLLSRQELQGNIAQTLLRSHVCSVPTFLLGSCIFCVVHGIGRTSTDCRSWPAGKALGMARLGQPKDQS